MDIYSEAFYIELNPFSNRVTLTAIVPGATPYVGVKCKGYEKVAISDQYLAIARKWLKIDVYMLRCVWQALNSLSIHVTFTAMVSGA